MKESKAIIQPFRLQAVIDALHQLKDLPAVKVAGMDCADEVETVERALKPLPGVRDVRVNLMGGKVVVAHDRSVTSPTLLGCSEDDPRRRPIRHLPSAAEQPSPSPL